MLQFKTKVSQTRRYGTAPIAKHRLISQRRLVNGTMYALHNKSCLSFDLCCSQFDTYCIAESSPLDPSFGLTRSGQMFQCCLSTGWPKLGGCHPFRKGVCSSTTQSDSLVRWTLAPVMCWEELHQCDCSANAKVSHRVGLFCLHMFATMSYLTFFCSRVKLNHAL